VHARLGEPTDDYEGVFPEGAVGGEPVFGGETPTYPWCLVRGKIRVFFGEDPIDSIMIRTTAARG
jgi:hypothetical protein